MLLLLPLLPPLLMLLAATDMLDHSTGTPSLLLTPMELLSLLMSQPLLLPVLTILLPRVCMVECMLALPQLSMVLAMVPVTVLAMLLMLDLLPTQMELLSQLMSLQLLLLVLTTWQPMDTKNYC